MPRHKESLDKYRFTYPILLSRIAAQPLQEFYAKAKGQKAEEDSVAMEEHHKPSVPSISVEKEDDVEEGDEDTSEEEEVEFMKSGIKDIVYCPGLY